MIRQNAKDFAQWLQLPLIPADGWGRLRDAAPAVAGRVGKRALLLLLFGMAAGPLIGFTIQFFARGRLIEISPQPSLARGLLFYMVFGVLMSFACYLTCGLPSRYIQRALQYYPKPVYLAFRLLLGLAGTLLGFALSSQIIYWIFQVHLIREEDLRLALILSGTLSCVLTLVISVFAKMRAEIRRAEHLLYESKLKEQLLGERTALAQLQALQAQINPHFFFNTLSSIVALLSIDTAAAKEIIIALADMHRYTLRCTHSKRVALKEELDFVRAYLIIEEVRFRDRLQPKLHLPEHLDRLKLPGLVLQPIVENAVRHGIAKNIGSGCIDIDVRRGDQDYTITVTNTAEQAPERLPQSWLVEGHALKNVDDRLSAIYGNDYELGIRVADDRVGVHLRLPIWEKEEG